MKDSVVKKMMLKDKLETGKTEKRKKTNVIPTDQPVGDLGKCKEQMIVI